MAKRKVKVSEKRPVAQGASSARVAKLRTEAMSFELVEVPEVWIVRRPAQVRHA